MMRQNIFAKFYDSEIDNIMKGLSKAIKIIKL